MEITVDRRVNPVFHEVGDGRHRNILTAGNWHECTTVTGDPVQDRCVLSF